MVPGKDRDSMLRGGWMSGTAIGLLFTLGFAPLSAAAQSLPAGGTVTHGDAAITVAGPNLTVTQTSKNAIISWRSFSVGGGASAHFENGSGATLNRVGEMDGGSIAQSSVQSGSVEGDNYVGGLVGEMKGGGSIAQSHATGNVTFSGGGNADYGSHRRSSDGLDGPCER